jgi:mannonate dehydratase
MKRREFWKGMLAAASVVPPVAAQEAAKRTAGLPPLKITDVKVITTSGGRNYRWVFLKIVTNEAGLWGIGSANNNYETLAVVAALEQHLKPWLIGKDPNRIEDLWQSCNLRTYWRGGPVNNNVVSAMDEALWDIKAKRANMPLYELLGGKAHDAVACYDHVGGPPKSSAWKSCKLRSKKATGTCACSAEKAAMAAAVLSAPEKAAGPRADTRGRRSTRNYTWMPCRPTSNMCAPK